MNLILFGPPGSGKGTQASKLSSVYSLQHISTGDMFRYEMHQETELGKKAREYIQAGELVPDSLTLKMLKNKIESEPGQGVIFDGFPRTVAQAKALDEMLEKESEKIDLLILLDVAEKEIIQRISERGKISGRSDDRNVDTIKKRIKVYKEETGPVFDYYNNRNVAKCIDGQGTINQVFRRLSNVLDSRFNS